MADIAFDPFDYASPNKNKPAADPNQKQKAQPQTSRPDASVAEIPKIHPGMFIMDRSPLWQSLRITGVGIVAAAGVFCTFLVCSNLIDFSDGTRLDTAPAFHMIDVVEDIPVVAPRPMERKIEKMTEVELPPELPKVEDTMARNDTGPGDGIDLTIRAPSRMESRLGAPTTMQMATVIPDGNYMPLVRIQPQYPRRALQKRIEGFVMIELTVSGDGTVKPDSIRVLEADPKGVFEKAAMQAAQKFKYRPKVVNGQGVDVPHVTYRFSFELNKMYLDPKEEKMANAAKD